MEDLVVYDIVPKTFADSSDDITVETAGVVYIVVKDPEYAVKFPVVNPGDELSIAYSRDSEISFDVSTLSTPTLVAGNLREVSVTPTTTPTSVPATTTTIKQAVIPGAEFPWLWIIAIIVIIIVVAYWLYNQGYFFGPKKKESGF